MPLPFRLHRLILQMVLAVVIFSTCSQVHAAPRTCPADCPSLEETTNCESPPNTSCAQLHCQPCGTNGYFTPKALPPPAPPPVPLLQAKCIPEEDLCILEPIPGMGSVTSIAAGDLTGGGAFFRYLNGAVFEWIYGIGIAMSVLNGTFGGLLIVLSNGDSGKIDAGKTRMIWSTIGLMLLLLAGVLLQFINPLGFQNI